MLRCHHDDTPYAGPVVADPLDTGADRRDRKRHGAWYTPPALVEALVREAVFPGARTVLDPACGDGRFLVASALPDRTGVDIDPEVAARHGYLCDDALDRDWGATRFDVVLGNPPFLGQMARATTRGGRSQHGGGPYADTAVEFLALALRLTRPGGRFGLVLPQSVMSARDAAPVRAIVDDRATMRWMWWSSARMFDANVRVWAAVWEVGGEPGPIRRCTGPSFTPIDPMSMPSTWSSLLTGSEPAPHDGPVLGDIARFSVDFRDQYYGLIGAVSDTADGPPLVTSGLIEPRRCLWGQRPVRFARERYAAPRVDLDRLAPRLQQWAERRLVPKILIANQTRIVEAVHDPSGEWLPSVPVITCTTEHTDDVMATLDDERTLEWLRHHRAGSGLSADSLRLSPSLLADVPLRGRR